jgi:hypothetical protein
MRTTMRRREVVTMVALSIIVVLLIIATTALLWPIPDAATEGEAAATDGTANDAVQRETAPTTLEGALVAQLLHDEITRGQYQQALGRLAARDDERNPLSVPSNGRPDAAA